MYVQHRIEIRPNKHQQKYFRKCFKVAIDTYNWALSEWEAIYNAGGHANAMMLRRKFNTIKKEHFPEALEVTTYASSFAFDHIQNAFVRFFKRVKDGVEKKGYPRPHRIKESGGSFTFGLCGRSGRFSDINESLPTSLQTVNPKRQWIFVGERCGWVKMMERIRFNGKCTRVVIQEIGDKWYATFLVKIERKEWDRTHKPREKEDKIVGIDLGIEKYATLSNGVGIENPRFAEKTHHRLRRLERLQNRKQGNRTKKCKAIGLQPSKNAIKAHKKVASFKHLIAGRRYDYLHKLSSVIVRHFSHIAIEGLDTSTMGEKECGSKMKGFRRAVRKKRVSDAGFVIFRNMLLQKAALYGVNVKVLSRWYASTKICSCCGRKSAIELHPFQRTFVCEHCLSVIDRDLNAARNLRNRIGVASPESVSPSGEPTPADSSALLSALGKCQIASFEVGSRRVWRKRKSQLAVHA